MTKDIHQIITFEDEDDYDGYFEKLTLDMPLENLIIKDYAKELVR